MGGIATQALVLIAYIGIARHLLPSLGAPTWDWSALRRLLRFSSFVSISQVVGPVLTHVEKFMIGNLLTLGAVAFYSVPYNLVWAFTILPSSISGVLFPTLSRLTIEGDDRRRSSLLLRSTKYVFTVMLPIAVALALFSHKFLAAWMGAAFAQHSSSVLQVLAFAVVINSVAAPAYYALQAMGRPEIPAAFHVSEVCLYIPFCFFLIGRYGVLGGALAWAARVGLDTVLLTAAFTRVSNIPYRRFLSAALLRPTVAAIGLFPFVYLASSRLPELNRVATLVVIGAVGLVYWIGVCALALDHEEKRRLGALTARWIQWPGLMPAAVPPVKII
jgi:O-antigen/teichoic acid export membrane protein